MINWLCCLLLKQKPMMLTWQALKSLSQMKFTYAVLDLKRSATQVSSFVWWFCFQGTGQKVQGVGWTGSFQNVVLQNTWPTPFIWHKTEWPTPQWRLKITWPIPYKTWHFWSHNLTKSLFLDEFFGFFYVLDLFLNYNTKSCLKFFFPLPL